MASGNDWSRVFHEYDFDDAYFNNVGSNDACEDNDDDWTDLESEHYDEAEFNLVNPIVEEMYAYMHRHFDKQPMRKSALTGRAYMDEISEGNPAKCYEMFRMTPELLDHLVDELARHGYLRDGQGGVNATQAVAMLLYILGHNTRFRCVADRFQHSTETVSQHFRRALQAVHAYAKHLIKPDQNVTGLPEHLQVKGGVNATQAVAMLLYILGHNTRFRCVADRFQHSTETVSRHFRRALQAIHAYAKHLIKPDRNVTGLPEHLQVNKYWPWFERCVGAIDGMHVSARPPANATQAHRSRKSTITTNVLCVCNMDIQFTYIHAGWKGSTNDSRVLEEAINDQKHGFPWPPTGSYYLVDSSLPIDISFLPPHKSTRYHAQVYHSSGRRPTSKKELYNYRHSSLRMVIERSFGVLKARFPILNLMSNFKQTRQHYIILVYYALHNFIRMNNRSDELFTTIGESVGEGSESNSEGSDDIGASTSSETERHVLEMSNASTRATGQFRDSITDAMWDDYVARGNVR